MHSASRPCSSRPTQPGRRSVKGAHRPKDRFGVRHYRVMTEFGYHTPSVAKPSTATLKQKLAVGRKKPPTSAQFARSGAFLRPLAAADSAPAGTGVGPRNRRGRSPTRANKEGGAWRAAGWGATNKEAAPGVDGRAHRVPRRVWGSACGWGPMYSECYTLELVLYSELNTHLDSAQRVAGGARGEVPWPRGAAGWGRCHVNSAPAPDGDRGICLASKGSDAMNYRFAIGIAAGSL